jgi:hypothetical protein
MASYEGSIAHIFPAGATVSAYEESNWLHHELPPQGAPKGAADGSGVVQANGSLSISGLTANTRYVLTDGNGRYVSYFCDPADLGGGGGGPAGPSDDLLAAHDFDVDGVTGWSFSGGAWTVNGSNQMQPPQGSDADHYAFYDAFAPAENVAVSAVLDAWGASGVYLHDEGVVGAGLRVVWASNGELHSDGALITTVAPSGFAAGDRIEVEKIGRLYVFRHYVGDPFETGDWAALRGSSPALTRPATHEIPMRVGLYDFNRLLRARDFRVRDPLFGAP